MLNKILIMLYISKKEIDENRKKLNKAITTIRELNVDFRSKFYLGKGFTKHCINFDLTGTPFYW